MQLFDGEPRLLGERCEVVRRGNSFIAETDERGRDASGCRGNALEFVSGLFHFSAEVIHGLPGGLDLLRGDAAEVLIFLLEPVEALLRCDDFALKVIPFRGAFCDALLRVFERFETFLCRLDRAFEVFLFLRQKLYVAGIELEQLVDVFEVGLRFAELLVHALEGGLQF